MATWSGWAADFLAAASLPNTDKNRQFLNEWAANATSPNCANNPVDLTHHEPGSSNCGAAAFRNLRIQRYTSRTWARTAFNSQIHSGNFGHLLAALQSGNPYAVTDFYGVQTDLNLWGSANFGAVYVGDVQSSGPTAISAPRAHKGWADMRRSINHRWPAALAASDRQIRAALRSLHRAHRVH